MSEPNESQPRVDPETGEVITGPEPAAPAGPRGIASVARERAKRSMLQRGLMFTALAGTAFGALYMVTPHANTEHQAAAEAARRERAARLNAELPVRRLHVDPAAPVAPATQPAADSFLGPKPDLPGGVTGYSGTPTDPSTPQTATPGGSPHQSHADRLLSAPVMYRAANASPSMVPVSMTEMLPPPGGQPTAATEGGTSALGASLKGTTTPAVKAERLPNRRWLLPKGAFVDCTLETAIDSTLPGMTTCVLALDVFSADGTVVLLERGTRLVGEARADIRPGQKRVAVLWTEARTPTGVIAHLDSLGTDEIGRSGVPGTVDNHFGDRFGAAILISMIDAGAQALANSSSSGSGSVVVNPSRSSDVLTETLRQTIAIPPTINVPQGARLQVFVARDVDFRSVYALKDRT